MNRSTRFWANFNIVIITLMFLVYFVSRNPFYLLWLSAFTPVAIFMLLLGVYSANKK